MATEWYVGQPVLMRSVNERGRGPYKTTITRVGRKYVYIEQHGRERSFTIDGSANDAYGHEWLQTPEAYAHQVRMSSLRDTLKENGITVDTYADLYNNEELLTKILSLVVNGE